MEKAPREGKFKILQQSSNDIFYSLYVRHMHDQLHFMQHEYTVISHCARNVIN